MREMSHDKVFSKLNHTLGKLNVTMQTLVPLLKKKKKKKVTALVKRLRERGCSWLDVEVLVVSC